MSPNAYVLFQYLRRQTGTLSIEQLQHEVKLSKTAIRQAFIELREDGYIDLDRWS